MRNLFVLLIFVPLFLTIDIPFPDWEWNWDWNFDWFNNFIQQLKTGVPKFIEDMKEDLKEFISQAESEKDKIIKDLTNKTMQKYQEIKNNKDEILKDLIEKATTAAKHMSYKICNATHMETYEECRNNKKEVFKGLIEILQEKFKCSNIIYTITDLILKEDIGESLKYVLFLVNSITANPDAIQQGKAQVIYELMYCLETEIEKHWPEISAKLTDQTKVLEFKKDITNILITSIQNLVEMIRFEEFDGFIEKADEKTGLISSDEAKKVHKHILNMLQKLNEFGEGFYNLTATLAVKVSVRPEELDIEGESEIDFPEKGIKIVLHGDYLFSLKVQATSIQSVVFDSPLVSLRGRTEIEGGTSNTFVGITLYGKDGKIIEVDDINIDKLRPIIYYRKKLFKAMTTCLFYNEKDEKIENTGVETQIVEFDGEEYIKCIPKHLTTFTIGSYESKSISNKTDNNGKSNTGKIVLAIFLCLLFIGAGIFGYIYWRKKHNNADNSQMNQAFPNRDGLLTTN